MKQQFKNSFGQKKRARAFLSALTILMAVLLFAPVWGTSLVLSSGEQVLFEKKVTDDVCEVKFRHSVNKGLIREVYRIDPENKKIALVQSFNQSFGAGMLDTVEDTAPFDFRFNGTDYYVMDFPAEWQNQINYIGGNIAQHVFIYQDAVVNVGLEHPKKPFSISARQRSLFKKLTKRL